MPPLGALLALWTCAALTGSAQAGIFERLFGQTASICQDAVPLGATCSCPRQRSRLYQGADCSARNITILPKGLALPHGVPTVTFEQNGIAEVLTHQFTDNDGVRTLRMSKNRLSRLEADAFSHLSSLETLLLDKNQLTQIDPMAFRGLTSLTRLDLGFNRLQSLPVELFSGTSVRQLQLHYNPLVTLQPEQLVNLPQLQLLDLDSTDLTTLPPQLFAANQQLVQLLLPHNQLTQVPAVALSGAGALQTLDLSGNLLTTIPPRAFQGTPGLRRLVLSSMRELISVQQHAFSGLHQLEELLCQFSPQLSSLHPAAFTDADSGEHLQRLTRVDLKENGLTTLAPQTLPWQRMEFVDLEMNPWNCDCNMAWVAGADYDFENEPLFKCELPEPLRGKPLAILREEQLVCEDDSGSVALIVCLALLGVGALAALVLVVWKFKVLRRVQTKLFVRPKYATVRREADRVEVEGMEWDHGDIGV